ncbi:TPA: retron St85 family effector protein, partial [Clostridioides difficile]|nr:retron St85 family effector protein [Clostridioides difficile]
MVRTELENNKIRVLYPEDLFMDILSKNKSMDLLSLENLLADNSDVICIIPESPGSLVELGAFTNNEKTLENLFVVINEKYKAQKSFIMTGPIKYIMNQKGNNRITYYNEDLNELITLLKIKFRKFIKMSKNKTMDVNTIIGQYYFMQLVIYFTKHISNRDLEKLISYIYIKNKYKKEKFNMIFSSSLKLLYKNRHIKRDIISGKISLTDKGNIYVEGMIYNLNIKNRGKLYDSIRYGILYSELYGKIPL